MRLGSRLIEAFEDFVPDIRQLHPFRPRRDVVAVNLLGSRSITSTNIRKSSDGSMRKSPSGFALDLLVGPIRILSAKIIADHVARETPHLIHHGESFRVGFSAQDIRHGVVDHVDGLNLACHGFVRLLLCLQRRLPTAGVRSFPSTSWKRRANDRPAPILRPHTRGHEPCFARSGSFPDGECQTFAHLPYEYETDETAPQKHNRVSCATRSSIFPFPIHGIEAATLL
jgi:hypothetical protein